jgi:hypothetical protein
MAHIIIKHNKRFIIIIIKKSNNNYKIPNKHLCKTKIRYGTLLPFKIGEKSKRFVLHCKN